MTAQLIAFKNLRAYRFPLLQGTTHAVFTRLGGVSPSPWNSLNFGATVGDAPENVSANFALACNALGIEAAQTATTRQVHGNKVVVARAGNGSAQFLGDADAMITRAKGVYLTMRFADCIPLLFFDPVTQSVGAAHAGWRGTMQNVMSSTIKAMQREFGSRAADIRVVIGPGIGPCCYRVGDEVLQAAQGVFHNPAPFFAYKENSLYFDLWQTNFQQAQTAGVTQIAVSRICTACNTHHFFSHRAEKGKTGRFAIFIGLAGDQCP